METITHACQRGRHSACVGHIGLPCSCKCHRIMPSAEQRAEETPHVMQSEQRYRDSMGTCCRKCGSRLYPDEIGRGDGYCVDCRP